MSGARIDGVTVRCEIENEDVATLKKQMINLASHMAPASGIIRALEHAAAADSAEARLQHGDVVAPLCLKCQRLSAAPC